MRRMTRLHWGVAVLIVGAAPWAVAGEPTLIIGEEGLAAPAATLGGAGVLFDSVDENLNPVSMADMIDGRPLVMAVSSCSCQPGYIGFQVLEELYQKYKDRVNFLWVYTREGHPEESHFLRGFETRDLGWEHRYFRPTTMEERAQRARWMKTDLEPDAEIPMLIDYVNSPLGNDNEIWDFYLGAGFYAGFVLDCDGTVINQVNWAWHGPGGQWWRLPLASASSLESFLNNYLANPPACYGAFQDPPGPLTPHTAEVLSEERGQSPTVLIVDDDDGRALEGYFKIPLDNLKLHYRVWDVQENGSPSLGSLEEHNVVVWFTGSAAQDTLTPTDQDNLADYLDGGGKLLLSGQHISQDIGDSVFSLDYLHSFQVDDDTDISSLLGVDILSGIDPTLSGNDGAGNQRAPSQIGLLDGATGVFRYDTPNPPAWGGLRWEGDYQVVYFAFGLEGTGGLGAAALRYKIMKKVFAWFDELPCPADIDFDNDVDLEDIGTFAVSMSGPGPVALPPGVDFTHFAKSDLDLDLDVDLVDFADFQRRFGEACD